VIGYGHDDYENTSGVRSRERSRQGEGVLFQRPRS
jgi:hypothetical protein